MPFLEGMGDKRIPGAPKRSRAPIATDYSADAKEQGPGISVVPDELPSCDFDGPRPSPNKRKLSGRAAISPDTSSSYGLASKSEFMYPEAYRPVAPAFWHGLSEKQVAEVTRLQAVAQEKVGFERGTKKFFIEDFDPDGRESSDPEVRLVALAAPRLVFGGALLGAGAVLVTLGLLGYLPPAQALGIGFTAALAGSCMLILSR